MKWLATAQWVLCLASLGSAFDLRQTRSTTPRDFSTASEATALPMNEMFDSALSTESKVGVLMLNLGGPETGDDVEGKSPRPVSRRRSIQETFYD